MFKQNKGKDNRYTLTPELVCQGLSNVRWPGRLEKIMDAPLVILDGAHNLKAAQVLAKYLASHLGDKKLTLVIGVLDDKPYEQMLRHLVPLAHRVVITKAKIDRSLETGVLKSAVENFFKGEVRIIEDVGAAVSHAISTSSKNDAVCIAGSLYVAGEAKEKFNMDFI
ncbi:MAG: hypothetical protein CSA29_05075 [Desulfobacterales bacterium]|nr:MAG: hypothetical protein CSA29_05075 [Desulfobacterales bacterium]